MNGVSLGLGLIGLGVLALAAVHSKGRLSRRVSVRPKLKVAEPIA